MQELNEKKKNKNTVKKRLKNLNNDHFPPFCQKFANNRHFFEIFTHISFFVFSSNLCFCSILSSHILKENKHYFRKNAFSFLSYLTLKNVPLMKMDHRKYRNFCILDPLFYQGEGTGKVKSNSDGIGWMIGWRVANLHHYFQRKNKPNTMVIFLMRRRTLHEIRLTKKNRAKELVSLEKMKK